MDVTHVGRARIDFPSPIGVWWAGHGWPIRAAQDVAREIEDLGYGSLFLPEVSGSECLTQSTGYLAATRRLVVGTDIANIYVRPPAESEGGARVLTELYPGRFVSGLGVSRGPLIAGEGRGYNTPLRRMRVYLDRMAAVPSPIEPACPRPPLLLTSLGPNMVELSGRHADGARRDLILPAQTRVTREILGPDNGLVSKQSVAIGDRDSQLWRAKRHLSHYCYLPNYSNSLQQQGFDRSDPRRIRAADPKPGRNGNGGAGGRQSEGTIGCRCRSCRHSGT